MCILNIFYNDKMNTYIQLKNIIKNLTYELLYNTYFLLGVYQSMSEWLYASNGQTCSLNYLIYLRMVCMEN